MYISKEENPLWDKDKQRLIGDNEDSFYIYKCCEGEKMPGIWYKVIEENGDSNDRVIGFGWIDENNTSPEISIVIDNQFSHKGIGCTLTDELCNECKKNGASKVEIVVRAENSYYKRVIKMALKNGFHWNLNFNASYEVLCKVLQKGFNLTMEKKI